MTQVPGKVLIALLFIVPLALASEEVAPGLDGSEPLFEHDEPIEPIMSAQGDVVFIGEGDSQDVYIMLGNESEHAYELAVGPLEQGEVELEVPVTWTQTILISSEENVTVNLWNHNESIPHSFLSDVLDMEVALEGEVISEVAVMNVPEGEWNITIRYRTPPVQREVVCEKQTVQDLLPPGAEVISSDLPLDTYVQEVCRIRLYHESHTPYSGVSFQITEIDRDSIVSIYSVEHEEYLYLKNETLYIPRR